MNKKLIISLGAIAMATTVLFSAAGCGGKGSVVSNTADPERTFTYFIPKVDGIGVGGSYDSYDQNPQVMWLTKDPFTYKTATKSGDTYVQGEEVTNNVALRFESSTTGQEQNGFITNLNSGVDILDMEYAPETARTMYENGKLMDLTYWVENYMPNYLSYAEKFGMSDLIATHDENGNKQYLQLYSLQENVYWYYYGYQYRRDWILDYGKVFDTKTGEVGSQTFKEANPDWGWSTNSDGEKTWTDGILFPSWYGLQYTSDGSALGTGTLTYNQQLYDYMHGEYKEYSEARAAELEGELSHLQRDFATYQGQWPATISDWEWMLDIFQVAVNDLFPGRGYCMSLYQSGYVATGNLVSSFGGSGVEWHKNSAQDGIVLGADQSSFKVYVDTMNDWYSNGWIDKNFQTHTDLLWRTDEKNVRQGYVGLYFGMNDQLFDGMDLGIGNTQGVYTLGMPYPVNDKYGAEENKYVMPHVMYGLNHEVNSIMITTQCEKSGKDLAALFTMLDATYTEEMGAIKSWGLTDEMLSQSQEGVREIYEDLGYPHGTVEYDEEKQAYYRREDALNVTTDDQYVVSARRMYGLEGFVVGYEQTDRDNYEMYLWNFYKDTGYLTKSFFAQLNDDQYSLYMDKLGQMRNMFASDIPKFIKGEKSMADFDSWYAEVKSRLTLDNITRLLNNVYSNIYG